MGRSFLSPSPDRRDARHGGRHEPSDEATVSDVALRGSKRAGVRCEESQVKQ